jgi:transcription elongation factor GreA
MPEPIYLTPKGFEKIKEDLKYLKEVRRSELSAYMGKAIEDGDLRESAAYDEARLLQSENETRIADLEEIIYRAVVVEAVEGEDPVARLGASLLLEDASGKRETFYLVGTHEADIFENRISDESPLGQEMMGKRKGDKVIMKGSKSHTVFQVISITFD